MLITIGIGMKMNMLWKSILCGFSIDTGTWLMNPQAHHESERKKVPLPNLNKEKLNLVLMTMLMLLVTVLGMFYGSCPHLQFRCHAALLCWKIIKLMGKMRPTCI